MQGRKQGQNISRNTGNISATRCLQSPKDGAKLPRLETKPRKLWTEK